jgi:hypothetical protein
MSDRFPMKSGDLAPQAQNLVRLPDSLRSTLMRGTTLMSAKREQPSN